MENLTITTINNGDLVRKFAKALPQILDNITDENTDPKAARDIILKVRFKPDPETDEIAVFTTCQLKLAPNTGESVVHMNDLITCPEDDEEDFS